MVKKCINTTINVVLYLDKDQKFRRIAACELVWSSGRPVFCNQVSSNNRHGWVWFLTLHELR